jgi:hypothetical protein
MRKFLRCICIHHMRACLHSGKNNMIQPPQPLPPKKTLSKKHRKSPAPAVKGTFLAYIFLSPLCASRSLLPALPPSLYHALSLAAIGLSCSVPAMQQNLPLPNLPAPSPTARDVAPQCKRATFLGEFAASDVNIDVALMGQSQRRARRDAGYVVGL